MRNMIQPEPLYTRGDYVRTSENTFALMEVELIEPSLYFNMDDKSPIRFTKVFDEWMENRIPKAVWKQFIFWNCLKEITITGLFSICNNRKMRIRVK